MLDKLYARSLMEFLGTGLLSYTVYKASLSGLTSFGQACLVGLCVALLVHMLGRYSGAHFNPAISIILRIQSLRVGKALEFDELLETICYIFSQVLGSIIGMKIARAGHSVYPVYRLDGFMEEVLLTMILLFLVIIWSREGKLCPFAQPLSGIVMGGGVTFLAILGGLTSSGIFNPAILVGMLISSGEQQGIQLMMWAQLLAIAFVGLVIRAYQRVR